ncbi:MAG TPA: zf-HC2 domain-containing protein, partial [Actinomycetes bacterium]|nr:zf-HC2 domain-containing protein [Actinomycetes bacterium]
MTEDGRGTEGLESGDPFLEDDAAYVMGALSPDELRAFEEHLVGCDRCAASVAELSGMTGLLDRVPLDRVLQPGADREPLPDLLLGRVVAAARRERRRRSMWLVASGAVAAAAVAVAIAVVPQGGPGGPAGTTVAMTEVRPAAVTGTLEVTPVDWGTKVSLVCRWVDSATWSDPAERKTYRLVAVPRDGGDPQTLARWSVLPGEDATVVGSTDLTSDEIERIEMRAVADDTVLLEADDV